jgi:hypothetical protein
MPSSLLKTVYSPIISRQWWSRETEGRTTMPRSKLGSVLLVSFLALALVGIGAPVFGHGGDPTLVHACVNKNSGEVKIVAPTATCKAHETALDWPQTAATPPPAEGGLLHARSNFSLVSGVTQFAMFVEEGTESFVKVVLPRGGTLANLFLHPTAAPAGGAIVTAVVRVNEADTTLAVTHTSGDGTSATSNTVATVAVNQGDFVAVKFTESGAVVPGAVYRASFEFK